ncbi:protein ANTAGONIST OF LIKE HETEROCHROMATIN PROTEIN 1-like [Octopus sinensis]|uniref:Protein ANTAGONIST OF LIKE HETEROCHROMATIN PROTEIN 1-like n=1 Tax=Octopus sinensis TaxID=2607531 RepID=A0A6P7TM68_9MOLL|nr:protein ANTAGONIST OF LIKE HETEROCHROMATIN PROTEIN 1-like [Octopus sinensis]
MAELLAFVFAMIRKRRLEADKRCYHMKKRHFRRIRAFSRFQSSQRMYFVFNILPTLLLEPSANRVAWTKNRYSYWWDHIVQNTFSSQDWIENFRMSKQTFEYLCNCIRSDIEYSIPDMPRSLPIEKWVAVTVYILSSGCDYRIAENMFGIAISSAHSILRSVCQSIVKVLSKKYIYIPRGKQLESVIESFESRWGFPNCAGVINATHVPILTPQDNSTDYYNSCGWPSIVLQAVADDEFCFTSISTGWPGRLHNIHVFSNSKVYEHGRNSKLFVPKYRQMGDNEMPIVLIGDTQYPLLNWLMVPFEAGSNSNGGSSGRKLTVMQNTFNSRLDNANTVIETSFRRLKGRWQCLLRKQILKIDNAALIVEACCVLHNICELNKEQFLEEWLFDYRGSQYLKQPNERLDTDIYSVDGASSNIRHTFGRYFMSLNYQTIL